MGVGWELRSCVSPWACAYQHGLEGPTPRWTALAPQLPAVLIRPVSVTEIERTAREGLLMPPKSPAFFTPKLKTGFVIRSLSE